ncbi:efflux RND transporter periplasmic adaptor subunit [Singulisphaera sp. Ch08]|uniref:Efflux RND transporter periplasmic adaptor subunit n=1 Tax=Singulisphaera sp. Ch08 TaxID=3120278 RepID=A0AAU7C7J1_9BACT
MTTVNLIPDQAHPGVGVPSEPSRSARPWRSFFAFVGLLVLCGGVLGALFVVGRLPRLEQRAALHAETAESIASRPRVQISVPFHRDKPADLTLPGEIRAFQDTNIFARTDGYVKRYLVDIGDKVEAGALLAEIDTPELDQELKQAQALLAQAQANRQLAESRLELAGLTLRRSQQLNSRGAETRQVLDEYTAEFKVAEATLLTAAADIEAKAANANRLAELQKFQKVLAPYRGVITERNIDNGALIRSGSTQSLYRIAQTDKLKVYVNVPQANAIGIKAGQPAEVLVREQANRKFVGKVTRTSGAIETRSRTLLTEVVLPNEKGELYAGMYVKVRFDDAGGLPLLIPATTLVINTLGTRVAIVGPGDALHYQEVQLGRDYGQDVEILQGLSGNERLILNPTENLIEGVKVDPTESTVKTASAAGPGATLSGAVARH